MVSDDDARKAASDDNMRKEASNDDAWKAASDVLSQDDAQDEECDRHEREEASHDEAKGDEGRQVASQDDTQKGVAHPERRVNRWQARGARDGRTL